MGVRVRLGPASPAPESAVGPVPGTVQVVAVITLVHLALTSESEAGQRVLARYPDAVVRRALAASPRLCPEVANALVLDRDTTTSARALRSATDTALLKRFIDGSGMRARNAAHNPATPSRHLEAAARATHNGQVALAALCNPSLSAEVRREVLTPTIAHKLVSVGGSLGDAVVRANELAIANPWMADSAGAWTPMVRRGILGLPQLTQDQVHAACSGGVGRQGNVVRHPAMTVLDHPGMFQGASDLSLADRASLGNPAQDLLVTTAAGTSGALAAQVLFRKTPPPEPHIIGRLLVRFGLEAFTSMPYCGHAASRLRAAGWVTPLADYLSAAALEGVSAARPVHSLPLGKMEWETLTSLAAGWSGAPEELARAARALA